ncbi:MAG: dTMP kinase [Spirochaetaceae bacterium]|jgi:dTMP kinase|nr:dTMP kinase [Spirochaetaceae bacterium]
MTLKNFVVFEGCDGAGTTTAREIMRERLEKTPLAGKVFDTFEPTDGAIGKLVRAALSNSVEFTPEALAYLFAADRYEHIFGPGGVAERCRCGDIALSDRYVLSSYVYQGLLCDRKLVFRLNEGFPAPELLVFFDIEPAAAWGRIDGRGRQKEIYEYLDFQVKVRERYKELLPLCREQGAMVEVIDASRSREEVQEAVWAAVQKMSAFQDA